MPRLTEEQKLANKAAAAARDKAYKARRAEYEAALAAAISAEVIRELEAAQEQAYAQREAALAARMAIGQALSEDIERLELAARARVEELGIEALSQTARAANSALHKAKAEVEAQVKAAYPDIAGVFSALEWEARVAKNGKQE